MILGSGKAVALYLFSIVDNWPQKSTFLPEFYGGFLPCLTLVESMQW